MSDSFESKVTSDFQKLLSYYPKSATLNGVDLVDSKGDSSVAVVQGVAESLGLMFDQGGAALTLKVVLMFLKCGNPIPTENDLVGFNGRNYRIAPEGIEDIPGLWKINLIQQSA